MSDLISRQQAIDAVVSAMIDGADAELVEGVMELLPSAQPETPCYLDSPCEYQNKDIKLPSAQPVAKDINVPAKDCISRQGAIEIVRHRCKRCTTEAVLAITEIKQLPSAQPQRWDTCFSCPLSHGCPVIKGCTNDQAEQYAGEIPTDCPLDKESAQPERKKGKWINHRNDDGHNIADCDQCGNAIQWFDGDEVPRYCCMCGADMRTEGVKHIGKQLRHDAVESIPEP